MQIKHEIDNALTTLYNEGAISVSIELTPSDADIFSRALGLHGVVPALYCNVPIRSDQSILHNFVRGVSAGAPRYIELDELGSRATHAPNVHSEYRSRSELGLAVA
jgi:hypothetical protein